MGIESIFKKKEKTIEHKESSLQLRMVVGLEMKAMLGKITSHGREHLAEIPKDKKVIVVASHITDIDMQVTIDQLGKDFDLKVSSQSTNLDFAKDVGGSIGPFLAGRDNFLPIDYKKEGGQKTAQFNPDNFETMANALRGGNEVLVAGHKPSSGTLSRGGIAAPYLSQIGHGDFVILPVAVNIKSEGVFRPAVNVGMVKPRPETDFTIGKPIELDPIPGIEKYADLVKKKNEGGVLDPEESLEYENLTQALRSQSDIIMRSIAGMLPEEKRGEYKNME